MSWLSLCYAVAIPDPNMILILCIFYKSERLLPHRTWSNKQAVDASKLFKVVVADLKLGAAPHIRRERLAQFVGIRLDLVVTACSLFVVDTKNNETAGGVRQC